MSGTEHQADAQTLSETYETIGHLTDTIHQLDAQADEARRVAQLLENELDQLRGVIDLVANQHTPGTWMGRSATSSRRRLDDHAAEHFAAIRSIDHVIDDLTTLATTATTRSQGTRDALDSARRQAISLEFDLGRFDDVSI